MPDVKIKGYSGAELEYKDVPKVYLAAPESTPDNPVLVPFTYGEAVEGVEITPNFSEGDMTVTMEIGYLARSAVVKKPKTLVPENIAKDAIIAGIVGTHEGGSDELRYVTFMDDTGTVEYGKKAVAVGDDCADPIARGIFDTPAKESDEDYNYTFADGWATTPGGDVNSNALEAVNEDRTVYAAFLKLPKVLASGTCGDDLTWSISESGVLTISGIGAMYDYKSSSSGAPPWYNYRTEIVEVIINEGVTTVGKYAFDSQYVAIKKVTLPDSLTSIANNAFNKCQNAIFNTLPSNLTYIGNGAFNTCTALSSIRIPAGVMEISNNAFANAGLDSAIFEGTTMWELTQLFATSPERTVDISEFDASTVATMLRNTYATYKWKRIS